MRPVGATLRLFAQWLHPTTKLKNQLVRQLVFLSAIASLCWFLRVIADCGESLPKRCTTTMSTNPSATSDNNSCKPGLRTLLPE